MNTSGHSPTVFRPQDTLRPFPLGRGGQALMHSLPALEAMDIGVPIGRLPVSLRIVLESQLRNHDGRRITDTHIRQLATWMPRASRHQEVPFAVGRILLQDFTGVPLLCDLAAMRDAMRRFGHQARRVEPRIPVDLVIDHSVQVDHFREVNAFDLNLALEFGRNAERYRFIKWGMQAFRSFRVVPPGLGIVHQINLEYLARGVLRQVDLVYPDTLVGTDSHTTMINALGVVGWGVGGLEAEAAMLGQAVSVLTPDVVGVHLVGRLCEGVTATDLVLLVTERLRKARVTGKWVEFHGEGAAALSVPDRATLANMAPEYGATMGFFPPDETTAAFLASTGRNADEVDAFRSYFRAQQLFGMPQAGEIDYSEVVEIDLSAVVPAVAGPRRPQDRITLPALRSRFLSLLAAPEVQGGYGKAGAPMHAHHLMADGRTLEHGAVLIAAITSCTNTSNPGVMLTAGLLARRALARGLRVPSHVKTSLAPGSRLVTDYLERTGLLGTLAQLGFRVVAYGCTTCIGNSGPLDPALERGLAGADLIGVAVLSGNRNFEARIHPALKANFLMSPPLVVAFALAGRIDLNLTHDPIGFDPDGQPVYLRDLWPSAAEIAEVMHQAQDPQRYRTLYAHLSDSNPLWNRIETPSGPLCDWPASTYITRPPFLDEVGAQPGPQDGPRNLLGARALLILGDSVTTDHISPAGAIAPDSAAGDYLGAQGVRPVDFNSYGSRRGHHEVMVRGTFAHGRLRNRVLPAGPDGQPEAGGLTLCWPEGLQYRIHEAAQIYQRRGVPLLIFAGEDYGSGSSRDWAAKGTRLLGVRAVVARSFERIHRANLVGMGVLPLQFLPGDSVDTLALRGDERFDLLGLEPTLPTPGQTLSLLVHRFDGSTVASRLTLRVETDLEIDYLRHGGILPFVFHELLRDAEADTPSGPG